MFTETVDIYNTMIHYESVNCFQRAVFIVITALIILKKHLTHSLHTVIIKKTKTNNEADKTKAELTIFKQ